MCGHAAFGLLFGTCSQQTNGPLSISVRIVGRRMPRPCVVNEQMIAASRWPEKNRWEHGQFVVYASNTQQAANVERAAASFGLDFSAIYLSFPRGPSIGRPLQVEGAFVCVQRRLPIFQFCNGPPIGDVDAARLKYLLEAVLVQLLLERHAELAVVVRGNLKPGEQVLSGGHKPGGDGSTVKMKRQRPHLETPCEKRTGGGGGVIGQETSRRATPKGDWMLRLATKSESIPYMARCHDLFDRPDRQLPDDPRTRVSIFSSSPTRRHHMHSFACVAQCTQCK